MTQLQLIGRSEEGGSPNVNYENLMTETRKRTFIFTISVRHDIL